MKYLIFLLLSACSTTRYVDGPVTFERTSYFTVTNISKLIVTVDRNKRTVELVSNSDQVQALEKVAEGAAKGAASAFKP